MSRNWRNVCNFTAIISKASVRLSSDSTPLEDLISLKYIIQFPFIFIFASENMAEASIATPLDLPSPPFITVEGIPNFRDLGGYPISASKTPSIRTGAVYRCGEPSLVTKNGISTMQNLGITHIYDLRSNNEIERNVAAGRGGVVHWEGCERVFVPVFADKDYSPENLAIRYNDYASGTEVSVHGYIHFNINQVRGSHGRIPISFELLPLPPIDPSFYTLPMSPQSL